MPMSKASKRPMRKNGSVLPRMNSTGRMGVTMICSSVPISRSRTTANDGERDDEQRGEAADDAGNKEPAAAQIGVVPGALLELDGGNLLDELRRDAADAVLLCCCAKPSAICET